MKTKTRMIITTAIFAALTGAGAYISIPVGPAPITLQDMFPVLAGIMLGPAAGCVSQAVYVILGLLGAPVFAGGSGGLQSVMDPSFGYLLGFILAPVVSGLVYGKHGKRGIFRTVLACISGFVSVYVIGLPYMYIVLRYISNSRVTAWVAFMTGFAVFVPGDALKCAADVLLGTKLPRFLFEKRETAE